MRTTIMVIVKPFNGIARQQVYAVQDGAIAIKLNVGMDSIPQTVFMLSEKYSTNTVKISGNNKFAHKVAENIEREELLKYSTKNLDIEVL